MTVQEFARLCGGTVSGVDPSAPIFGFATDSRDVQPGYLFVAIVGANVDGHDYVHQALEKGAVASLVERPVEAPSIIAPNVVQALADFAAGIRAGFTGPVVGVTGSNGKTTTKEFIAATLSPLGKVLKNVGNRNSEFTSPLLWAELTPEHKAVVVEMGMRGFGQVAHLADFSKPTIGVVTCIGTAHIEMVGSRAGIARAKGELLERLPSDGMAVIWQEDEYVSDLHRFSAAPVRTYGFSQEAECRILGYRAIDWGQSVLRGSLDGISFEAELSVVGRHQALNAAAAILAAHSAGVKVEDAAAALSNAELPPMRLEVVPCKNCTVLLDAYNASPDSTVAALRALAEGPCNGRRVAVLGEMRELGDFEESGHRMVGEALGTSAVDLVLLTGGATKFIAEDALMAGFLPENLKQLPSLDIEAVTAFLETLEPNDIVLVKGSRALALEKAVQPLRRVQ